MTNAAIGRGGKDRGERGRGRAGAGAGEMMDLERCKKALRRARALPSFGPLRHCGTFVLGDDAHWYTARVQLLDSNSNSDSARTRFSYWCIMRGG